MSSAPVLVRLSRAVLTRAVRRGAGEGTVWGEAILAELHETTSGAEAVRWTLSSLPVVWRERSRRRWPLRVRLSVVLLIVVAVGALTNLCVATVVYQASGAMQPTFPIGTRMLVDKLGFHVTGLHRGDVVVVDVPGATTMVKRVAGLPGDAMGCTPTNSLTRNGVVVAALGSQPCRPVTVRAGDLYLLGDDLLTSNDSRDFGPVPQSAVVGRVVGKVWPL